MNDSLSGDRHCRHRLFATANMFVLALFTGLSLGCHSVCGGLTGPSRLEVRGQIVHPGCVGLLAIEPNGDALIPAVILDGRSPRGCVESSRLTPSSIETDGDWFRFTTPAGERWSYRVVAAYPGNRYLLQTELQTTGSFAQREWVLVRVAPVWMIEADTYRRRLRKVLDVSGRIPHTFNEQQALDRACRMLLNRTTSDQP